MKRVMAALLLLGWFAGAPSSAQNTPIETVESDRKWETDIENGPCSQLKDRLTDPPSVVAACNALGAQQPPCLSYKYFAQIWFDMRIAHEPALLYQQKMIDNLGRETQQVIAHRSPEFRARLQRLLSVTLNADIIQWKSGDKWGAAAYSRCMKGQFF